jgi:hypothetical protein
MTKIKVAIATLMLSTAAWAYIPPPEPNDPISEPVSALVNRPGFRRHLHALN